MQYVAIGIVAGILSGLFGIGGGIVIVPALVVLAHMRPVEAMGTSLAALLLPVGALGAYRYWVHGAIDIRAGLYIALGLFLGAYFGAELSVRLPSRELERAFAVFLVVVAGHMWLTS